MSILFLKGSTDPFCSSRWSPIQPLIMHLQPGHLSRSGLGAFMRKVGGDGTNGQGPGRC